MKTMKEKHDNLISQIFASDDKACFIERERILTELSETMADYFEYDREARILSELLGRVSVTVDENDVFVGRVVEALPDEGMIPGPKLRYQFGEVACIREAAPDMSSTFPNMLLNTYGHMTYNWEMIITKGLCGILADIETTAQQKGDPVSHLYAQNARIVIEAIKSYANRYAKAAREAGNIRAAEALERVPYEPAYDMFSGLQAIWLIIMIAGCYVGGRDFAFGKIDQYLYPLYKKEIEKGELSQDEIAEMLAFFFLKTNEITGLVVYNADFGDSCMTEGETQVVLYNPESNKRKPVPSQNSKQYVIIGGKNPNELSVAIMKAAAINNMAQPVFTVLLAKDAFDGFKNEVFNTLSIINDKMHIYNYDVVYDALIKKGVPAELAENVTYSGCCSMEFSYHTTRNEFYLNTLKVLCEVLGIPNKKQLGNFNSVEQILDHFKEFSTNVMQDYIDYIKILYGKIYGKATCVLDGLFICESAKNCRYPGEGGAEVRLYNFFFSGIANFADSLYAIDKLVYKDKRYTLEEFMEIVNNNYEGYEELLAEIKEFKKFGNDESEVDDYASMAGNAILDAIDAVKLPKNSFAMGSFYSLDRSFIYGRDLAATPDGRLAHEYISENQSPAYGRAKSGVTAELKSLSNLPFNRSAAGGLNINFSNKVEPKILKALTESYFSMGGLHLGITSINRETLEDAIKQPEKYTDLTVRLYGFSEYYTRMPKWQQVEYLERTAF